MPFGWKITITSPSIGAAGASVFTLADAVNTLVIGAGGSVPFSAGAGGMAREGLHNDQRRVVQKASDLFRAPYAAVFPRFNLVNAFSFSVQRSFQTNEACFSFVRGHADQVPVQGEITILQTSNTGIATAYMPNAVIERVSITQHQELGCLTRYQVVGNGPWQSSP